MTEQTITGKTVVAHIENPDQASTNFYWSFETVNGVFSFQTTIRGVLNPDQIQAHIKSAFEANAYIISLGGTARAGTKNEAPATPLPEPTPVDTIITEATKLSLPAEETKGVVKTQNDVYDTEKLLVTITNGKKYYRVKGGMWMKYGVTVWDEVLVKAGIPVGKLEGQEYDLKGYKATFIRKADGKPDKVTNLEKVA
jgi:hypothetical protein